MMADPTMSAGEFGQRHGASGGNGKPNGAASEQQFPRFLSSVEFIDGYKPRRPLIRDWDLKEGWLYCLTGPTGYAKTAIALEESVRLAAAGKRIVYLAGENADDVRARAILMCAKLGLAQLPATIWFVDRTFNLHEGMDHVRGEVAAMGGADLIVVDTSPAFQVASGGDEENSNPEAIRWALRLRELTRLEGWPAVLALCHPIKRPQGIEDCLPRGGGGFIAEVDGNYVSWLVAEDGDDKFFELKWSGKFRGGFEPLTYRIQRATCSTLVDADGNQVYSVWAQRADERQMERAARDQTDDEDAALMVMSNFPGQSIATWARQLEWFFANGEPAKSRVQRVLKRLHAAKLIRLGRGDQWQLLEAGKTEAKRIAERMRNEAV
jgi:hypothetical protein